MENSRNYKLLSKTEKRLLYYLYLVHDTYGSTVPIYQKLSETLEKDELT